jgi:hypothetical protein
MKTFFILLFSLCCATLIYAQSELTKRLQLQRLTLENSYGWVGSFDSLSGIATVYDKMYMGYIDSTGKIILPIKYSRTSDFSNGLGTYKEPGAKKLYWIDASGKIVRELNFSVSIGNFEKGLATYNDYVDGILLEGLMDMNGNIVVKNRYTYLGRLSSKYFHASNQEHNHGIINTAGDTVVSIAYNILYYVDTTNLNFIGSTRDRGYAIYDSSGHIKKYWGKEVYPRESNVDGSWHFQTDGLLVIQNQWKDEGAETALLNLELDTIVPMGRYVMSTINEGMIRFQLPIPGVDQKIPNPELKYGFLNYKGKIAIKAKYDFADYFTEGLCPVSIKDKWGYINKKGKMVIPATFDYALPFSRGYAKVEIKGEYFIVDKQGKVVLKSRR